MFCGEYIHTLDSKNRMTLPSRLRELLGDHVVLTRSVDPCLSLYPFPVWNEYASRLDALPQTETRQIRRFLFSSAQELDVDGQGRLLIPAPLCEYAGLSKHVRIIGVGEHAEIWDEERWLAEQSEENTAALADTLIKLGF